MPTSNVTETPGLDPLVQFNGKSSITFSGVVKQYLSVRIDCKSELTANLATSRTDGVNINGSSTIAFAGRVNSEPNIFGSAQINCSSNIQFSPLIRTSGALIINCGSTMTVEGQVRQSANANLNVFATILPNITGNFYQILNFRLLADGVSIPIESASVDASRRGSGETLNVVLTRPQDKSLITDSKNYTLEVARTISGVKTWTQLVSMSKLQSKDFSISMENYKPMDEVSFSTSSSLDDKLNKAATFGLILYDPSKLTVDASEIPLIYDTAGRSYTTTAIAVGGLDLYYILNKIYVQQCGFSSVQTNIKNYPIKRADWRIGESWNEGVKAFIGSYEPVTFEINNVLYIQDTTQLRTSGMPSALALPINKYFRVAGSFNIKNIEGYKLNYTENINGDYWTPNIEQERIPSGTYGNYDYQETNVTRYIREYRNNSNPLIIIGTLVDSELKVTTDNFSNIISRVRENFTYDYQGRQLASSRVTESLIPNLTDVNSYQLTEVRRETTSIKYGPHPTQPDRQIQTKLIRQTRGLIAIDSENQYLNHDFKQDFTKAHEAGNLTEGMTTEYGPIENYVETARPLPNGQVLIEVEVTDKIRNQVKTSYSEPRAGDGIIGGTNSRVKELIVLRNDSVGLTGKQVVDFYIGEIPLTDGIQLIRRKLVKNQTKNDDLNCSYWGLDPSLKRGMIYTLTGRNNAAIGTMLVEGYKITMSRLRTRDIEISTTIEGQEI